MNGRPEHVDGICRLLRGEPQHWVHGDDRQLRDEFLRLATYHGVTGLVYHALKQTQLLSAWPSELVARLRTDARLEAVREAMRGRELGELLAMLADAGVLPLLLKGTALAYTIYPEPALRLRADTDMLIGSADLEALSRVMARLGYARSLGVEGELVSSQASFSRVDSFGFCHVVDVHWRISNFHIFGAVLAYRELASHAIAVTSLGPHARTLRPVDALLLACMHRLGHQQAPYYVDGVAHYDSNRLIWLYDIHLLARGFTPEQWLEFAAAALAGRLQLLCADGLKSAQQAFGTRVPAAIEAMLARRSNVPALQVGRFRMARWRWELAELMALPTWRARFGLFKEHLLPSRAYLQEKYQLRSRRWLPILYLRRALVGVWKRL